jgi:uncharacterized protein involved in exopolysaccharide biosynthesis
MAIDMLLASCRNPLRIFFRRLRWILCAVFLAVAAAWVWLGCFATKEYVTRVEVSLKPGVGVPVGTGLEGQIAARMQSEASLRQLSRNLRFAVKENYCDHLDEEAYKLQSLDEDSLRGKLDGELSLFPRTEKLRPGGALLSHCWWLAREIPVSLDDLATQMDTQTLAYALEALQRNPGEEVSQQMISAAATEDSASDRLLDALRKKVCADEPEAKYSRVRGRAVEELKKKLAQGSAAFGRQGLLEILREIRALRPLLETGLFYAGGETVAELRENLNIASTGGGLEMECRNLLHPSRPPFDKQENVITHLAVQAVLAMMKQEFASTGGEKRGEEEMLLNRRKEAAETEIEKLDREIYRQENLEKIAGHFPGAPTFKSRVEREKFASQTAEVDDPFAGLLMENPHAARAEKLAAESAAAERELAALREKTEPLGEKLNDPRLQAIEVKQKRERKVADPKALKLAEDLAAKKAEWEKLLLTCTERHPFVRKVTREIGELTAELEKLGASDLTQEQEEYYVQTLPNPELKKWREELGALERERNAVEKKRALASALAAKEKVSGKIAADLRNLYAGLLAERRSLRVRLERLQRQEDMLKMQTAEKGGAGVEFSVSVPPARPLSYVSPNWSGLLLYALGSGVLLAALAVFLLEKSDRSLRSAEHFKKRVRLPVLGEIPDLGQVGGGGNA